LIKIAYLLSQNKNVLFKLRLSTQIYEVVQKKPQFSFAHCNWIEEYWY